MADTRALLIFNEADSKYAQYILEELITAHDAFYVKGSNWELKLSKYGSSPHAYSTPDSYAIVQNYDWLILLRTSNLLSDPNVEMMVNTALTAVITPQSQVRLQNILAIGDPVSEHANKWPTIRTYDIPGSSKASREKAINQLHTSLTPSAQLGRGSTGHLPSTDRVPSPNRSNPVLKPRTSALKSPAAVRLQGAIINIVIAVVIIFAITGMVVVFSRQNPFVNKPAPTPIVGTIPPLHPTPTPIPTTFSEAALLQGVTGQQPVFSDPLLKTFARNNPQGWDTNNNDGCQIQPDGYHVTNKLVDQYTPCMEKQTRYKNFAYQVQVNFNGGDTAGLILRADSKLTRFYRFSLSSNGSYSLISCTGDCASSYNIHLGASLASGNVAASKQAKLTIIVDNNQFYLYINGASIDTAQDNSIPDGGTIGLYAGSTVGGPATDIIFSDMDVWNIKQA